MTTPITVYGDGEQTRSFCYVDDLVDGLLRLMEHPETPPGPVNLGNPRELTVAELVALVTAMTGTRAPVVRRPLPVLTFNTGLQREACNDVVLVHPNGIPSKCFLALEPP